MIRRNHIKLLFLLFFAAMLQAGFVGKCWSSDRKETDKKELKHHQHDQHQRDQHKHDQRQHDQRGQHKHDQHKSGQHQHDQSGQHDQHQHDQHGQHKHDQHQHDQRGQHHHKEKADDGKPLHGKETAKEKLKEHHKEKTTKKHDRREAEKEKLKEHHDKKAAGGKKAKGPGAAALKAKKKLDQYIEKISKFPLKALTKNPALKGFSMEKLGFANIKFDQIYDDNSTSFTASMTGQISIPVPDLTLLLDAVNIKVPGDIDINESTPYSFPLKRAKVPLWFGVDIDAKYKDAEVKVSLSFWGDKQDVYVDVMLVKSFKLSDFKYVADKVHLDSFKIPMQEEFGFANPANYSINNPEFIININKANVTVYGDVNLADRHIGAYLYTVPNVPDGNWDKLDSAAEYAKTKKDWNLMFDFGPLDMGSIMEKVTATFHDKMPDIGVDIPVPDLGTGNVEELLMIISLFDVELPVKYFDRTIRPSYQMATGNDEWVTHIVGQGVSFLTGLDPNKFSVIKELLDELNLHFENNLILMGSLMGKVAKAEADDDDGDGEDDGGQSEDGDDSGDGGDSGDGEHNEGGEKTAKGDDSGEDEESDESGSSFEPDYRLRLDAKLPTWKIPQDWQKASIVNVKGADMGFFVEVVPGAGEFGVETDFYVKIGEDNLTLTGALEAVVTGVDIGIALAGSMKGTWNIPYSPGLALKDPALKIKITEDDSYFGGVVGTTYLAGKKVMVGGDIEVQYTGEEAHPKAGAIKGSLNSLGFQDLAKIANICYAVEKGKWKPWDAPNDPIDAKNLIVDVEIKDVYFEFVSPGAADPDLGFAGTGYAMAGTLYVKGHLLGKILFNINEMGVKGLFKISEISAKGLEPYTDTFEVYMKDLEEYIVGLEKMGITKFSYLKGIKDFDGLIKAYIQAFDMVEGYAFGALKEIEGFNFDGLDLKFALNTSELPYFGLSTGFLALNQLVRLDIEVSIHGIKVDVDFPNKKLVSQYIPDVTIKKATLNKDMGLDILAAITLQGAEVDLEGIVDLNAKKISLTGALAKLTASSIVDIESGGTATVSGAYDGDSIDLKADANGYIKISGVNIKVKGPFNKDGVPNLSAYFPDEKIVSKNAPNITIKKATLSKDLLDIEAAITIQDKEVDLAGTLDLKTKEVSLTAQGQNIPIGASSVADAGVTVSGKYAGENSDLTAKVEGSLDISGVKISANGTVNKDGTIEFSVSFPGDKIVSKNAPDIKIKKTTFAKDVIDIEAVITLMGAQVNLEGKLDLNSKNVSLTGKAPKIKPGSFEVNNANITVSGKYAGNNSDLSVAVKASMNIAGNDTGMTGTANINSISLAVSGADGWKIAGFALYKCGASFNKTPSNKGELVVSAWAHMGDKFDVPFTATIKGE